MRVVDSKRIAIIIKTSNRSLAEESGENDEYLLDGFHPILTLKQLCRSHLPSPPLKP